MAELSLLGLFAHPDDEQLMSGTFAKYAAEGIRTGLICTTRGEYGEIADPALATPETLGHVRELELRAACAVVGIKYLYFLDYKDSGWFDRPENDAPDSFNNADPEEATEALVRLIREFRPTVMVTFDPGGGYGHLDHVQVWRFTSEAFDAAADPARYPGAGGAWQAQRLYYTGFPRSRMQRFGEVMERMDLESSYRDLNMEQKGFTDEEITNVMDVREWVAFKEKSMSMHATQMDPNSLFTRLPADMLLEMRATEYFSLAKGAPLPDTPDARGDLFAGLR
ncbi:MAG: mycothiol S-conjugate amidase [Chloroflexia bacterium]|jgi:LmbE family N-acetylglucosaminyl deacetylase|nr:mycothiol S-conjugate amidase [Chloroflexia bacterium]